MHIRASKHPLQTFSWFGVQMNEGVATGLPFVSGAVQVRASSVMSQFFWEETGDSLSAAECLIAAMVQRTTGYDLACGFNVVDTFTFIPWLSAPNNLSQALANCAGIESEKVLKNQGWRSGLRAYSLTKPEVHSVLRGLGPIIPSSVVPLPLRISWVLSLKTIILSTSVPVVRWKPPFSRAALFTVGLESLLADPEACHWSVTIVFSREHLVLEGE
ncbi:hypothetical protein K438DRAFT_1103693 [Mycena galopus ATCC 62051]|nr:hypothetical protein K438DRAFT_1103693 [Mycena galopus ATCC 62051]